MEMCGVWLAVVLFHPAMNPTLGLASPLSAASKRESGEWKSTRDDPILDLCQ